MPFLFKMSEPKDRVPPATCFPDAQSAPETVQCTYPMSETEMEGDLRAFVKACCAYRSIPGVFRELPGCGFQCVYDPDRVEKDANDQISTESIWEEWLLCADKAIDPSNRTEARKPTRENAPCTLIQGTEKESSVKSVSSFSTTGVIILLVVVITMILTILLLYRYRATPILQKIWKKIRNSFGPTSDFQNPKGIDLPKPGDDRASART